MGGGNTYALLQRLRGGGLLEAIRARVPRACRMRAPAPAPTWPGPPFSHQCWNVVGLDRFDALGLVGFNINPHYKEADPAIGRVQRDAGRPHPGISRDQHEPGAGAEEGAWVICGGRRG